MGAGAKKTVSHAGIYALGNVLRNAVSFIMLPIYTRYLSPADYGTIELLSMLVDFVSIIFGMRLSEAIFRYYSSATSDIDKKTVISTSLFLSVLLSGIGVILVMLFSAPLAHLMFGDYTYSAFVKLFALTMVLQALIEVPMIYIRVQERPWLFIGFSLFRLVLQLGLNIYLVVIKGMHVEGVIYSALISGGVMACLLLLYVISTVGVHITYKMTASLMRFSLPLMLASLGSFYLTFGDRYFLRVFGNLTDVGIYALGYKFGFILIVLMWDPFEKIWATQRYEVYKRPDALIVFQRTFVFMSVLMLSAALGISLFVKDLLKIMSDPAFYQAYAIVPIVLAAYVIQAWTSYCYFGLLLGKNTIQITYGSAIAVLVITIAYLSLIPLYGVFGAAWATVIGFLARLYWVYRKSKLDYDMQLPWNKVWLLSALAICIYAASWLAPEEFLPSVLVRTFLLLLYFVIFMKLPILSASEKNAVMRVLKNPKSLRQAFG